ncbi:glycerol-3-phosphate dehydrogenase (NAD(P)+) [Faunimonas pinastri]|uniref:Glycerol-3-phosphate dehydrogenase [NAD(P)+] n=1 Tax=Faunimonas pinastri TaxID=1855383 RepID=A0A1H9IQE9_9HYPH|nr:NAD(P)H-dependent glycerol-3-phosphate dehydrogenase [Faunimonas pinastri]SEQ76814.1 glycerol-3-phosphate dehydrogenase (NAD(P)+) [Faunimonas pinastri]
MTMDLQRVVVIGAGAFGTALAVVAARSGRDVCLVTRNEIHSGHIRDRHANEKYLPGVAIHDEIDAAHDVSAAADADLVLMAVPSQATRATAEKLAAHLRPGVPVIACAKGLERDTGLRQTEILSECLPGAVLGALSGPGFAREIAHGLPTAVTVASTDMAVARHVSSALSTDDFRCYASDDPVGVELGGAAKNVLAIACGIAAGKGLGESARAALISRGLAEMTRLGTALGARPETFMGLSGLGDLVLTATSTASRNTSFGIGLGEGRSVHELLASGEPLAEGAHTARTAALLAREHEVDAPIIAAVAAILDGAITVDEAIDGLVTRPLKAENA